MLVIKIFFLFIYFYKKKKKVKSPWNAKRKIFEHSWFCKRPMIWKSVHQRRSLPHHGRESFRECGQFFSYAKIRLDNNTGLAAILKDRKATLRGTTLHYYSAWKWATRMERADHFDADVVAVAVAVLVPVEGQSRFHAVREGRPVYDS